MYWEAPLFQQPASHGWNVSGDQLCNLGQHAESSVGQSFLKAIILRELFGTPWGNEPVYCQVLAATKAHVTYLPPPLDIIVSVRRGQEVSHGCQG